MKKRVAIVGLLAGLAALVYWVVKNVKVQVFKLDDEDDDEEDEGADAAGLAPEPGAARAAGLRYGVRSDDGLAILNMPEGYTRERSV